MVAVSFAVQASAIAAIWAALLRDAPLYVVYSLAALFTIASVAVPATVASLLVHHARSPEELIRWNVARSVARAGGSLVGPLMTAVVLASADATAVFGAIAVALASSAVVAGRRLPADDRLPTQLSARAVLADAASGLRYVVASRAPRRIVAFLGATEFLLGAVDLVVVTVAFDRLGSSGSVVALFAVAFAAGTLGTGAAASRRPPVRLGRPLWVGALLFTLPIVALEDATTLAIVLVVAGLLGVGNGLVEVAAHTMLQRSCSETITSRVYGVLDSTSMIAAAIGAAGAGRLIDAGAFDATVLAIGVGGAVVLLLASLRLGRVERSLPTPDATLIDGLRSVPFLRPLPQPTIERLGLVAERRTAASGERIITEGDDGREFFVLVDGAVDVTVSGHAARRLSAPAWFGEVALLRDCQRTATVVATGACELLVLDRAEFLDAVGRTATCHRLALDAAHQYRPPDAL